MSQVEVKHGHLFCGLGGGAKGFNQSYARVGKMETRFRCLGGIDSCGAAIKDFNKASGVPGTVMDLFSREQYMAFHGHKPPVDWREAMPADIHRAFNYEQPHVVFLSAPCKGFSGLLAEKLSVTDKYQALNALTLRGVWLSLEAYKNDPIEFYVFENVPRIATRGRYLLDQILALFRAYGYLCAETKHDCGEIGNLAQGRVRFLLVSRHPEKVPSFLYEPIRHPLRGVGEVIGKLPIPGPVPMLPMHRLPMLQWKTWVRLAFVTAGKDWRSLKDLNVEDGFLTDFGIMRDDKWRGSYLGVQPWDDPSCTVTGKAGATTGTFSVADVRAFQANRRGILGVRGWEHPATTITANGRPMAGSFNVADVRIDGHFKSVQHGVGGWEQPAATITSQRSPGQGRFSVADPRMPDTNKNRQNGIYRVVEFDQPSAAVTGAKHVAGAAMSVADVRASAGFEGKGKYRITPFDESAGTVIGASTTGQGAYALADPRMNWSKGTHRNKMAIVDWQNAAGTVTGSRAPYSGGLSVADPRPSINEESYRTQGYYGVVPWADHTGAVTAAVCHDNGKWSVADPRYSNLPIVDQRLRFATSNEGAKISPSADSDDDRDALPAQDQKLCCMIRALDGTWHRPFTTLELAALQGLVDPEEKLELDGLSDSAWRERIGNAVPPPAAQAIGSVIGRSLLLAWSGETFMLSNEDIWVRDIAVGLSVDQGSQP